MVRLCSASSGRLLAAEQRHTRFPCDRDALLRGAWVVGRWLHLVEYLDAKGDTVAADRDPWTGYDVLGLAYLLQAERTPQRAIRTTPASGSGDVCRFGRHEVKAYACPASRLIEDQERFSAITICVMKRLAVAVVALGVAACGGSRHPTGDARVTGRVRLCGGPRNQCFTEKTWVFVTHHGQLVAASVIRDGRFSFDLKPGRYTVRARGGGGLLGQRSVDAVAHKTTRVSIVYPVK